MDLVARPGGVDFEGQKIYRESRQKNESRWWQLKDFWIFSPRSLGKMIQIDEKKIRFRCHLRVRCCVEMEDSFAQIHYKVLLRTG